MVRSLAAWRDAVRSGRERDNMITCDGAVAVRIRASGDSIGTPDLDAVQEVQILTTNYPAEYGRSIGGQVRIITKSGGGDFHGSIYEYLQNPPLNANTWVRNHTNGVHNVFEHQSLNFRFDAFDFPNHPNWNAPDTIYTDATFGKITSKNGQRSMQASLRYSF